MTTAEFREKYRLEQIGPRYSGALHLAFTSALALGTIGLALSRVRAPSWALLTVPATFLYANLIEYLGHKGPMHKPTRLLRLVPAGLLLRALAGTNVAALFVATAMGYFLGYEWLHLAYHLGHGGPLRRHHAAHHDPAQMGRYNFNITFPVCDLLFGTALR